MHSPFVAPPTPSNVAGTVAYGSSISNNINTWQDCASATLTVPGLYLVWAQASFAAGNPNAGTIAIGTRIYDNTNAVTLAELDYTGGLMASVSGADNSAFGSSTVFALVRIPAATVIKAQGNIQNVSGSPTTCTCTYRNVSVLGYCRIAD